MLANRAMIRAAALVLVAGAAGTPLAALDEVQLKNGGTFRFYGQIDPAILSFDDGGTTTSYLVDNANSNTRFGFWLHAPESSGVSVSFNFETALGVRASNTASQSSLGDVLDWARTSIRKVDLKVETRDLGTFWLGQGSTASDGAATSDQSGTTLVTYNGISDTAGGFLFRTTGGALAPVPVGAVFPSFDGGRRARLRYDTPSFQGFTLSIAHGQEVLSSAVDLVDTDIALRYSRDFGDFRVRAAAAYLYRDPAALANSRSTIGSLSVLNKATGLNAALSIGDRDRTGEYVYAKLGWRHTFNRFGETAMSIDFYQGRNMVTSGSESQSFGLGIVQNFDDIRAEAYLGLRSYAYDDTSAVDYLDARSVLFGARWKF